MDDGDDDVYDGCWWERFPMAFVTVCINNRFRFLSFFPSPGKKKDAFPLETRFVSSRARYMHTFGSDENHILPEVESIRTMFASTIPQEISDPS